MTRPPGRKKVGIYARVSTEDQVVQAQIERCQAWVQAQGMEVGGVWAEVASGRDSDRPEQKAVMGEAMGRRVQVVAVAKVDRWARSLSHLSRSVERLHERGVAFAAVDQGLHVVPGDPTSELILGVLGSVAQWEASIISERTKEALAQKREEGVELGRPARPCHVCSGDRSGGLRAKVHGQSVPVCEECKAMPPAKRRQRVTERGGA